MIHSHVKINSCDFPEMGGSSLFKTKRSKKLKQMSAKKKKKKDWNSKRAHTSTHTLAQRKQQVHSSPEDVSIPQLKENWKLQLHLKTFVSVVVVVDELNLSFQTNARAFHTRSSLALLSWCV